MNRKPGRARILDVGRPHVVVDALPTAPPVVLVDTGILDVTVAGAQPLVASFRALSLFVMNQTDEIAKLTVTDGNDLAYMDELPIQPREAVTLPFGGQTFEDGVKWSADVDGALRAQMVGEA